MAVYTEQAHRIIDDANQMPINTQRDFNRVLGQLNEAVERMTSMQRQANSPGNQDSWQDLRQANQVLSDGINRFHNRYAYLF